MADPTVPIDLSTPARIHIIGLGGAGMSAIAEILIGTGHRVSGSDQSDSDMLARLAARGVTVFVGHDASQITTAGPDRVDAVAVSTAIPEHNVEAQAARAAGIAVLSRAELLAALSRAWRTVSVAGTHGKTTTSAMLTVALQGSGLDPAYIVGGDLRDLGRGAAVGSGDILVVEADESDGTFVELTSEGVIVTNVEPDHLDFYGDFDTLRATFERFVIEATGPRVICEDDPQARRLLERLRANDAIDSESLRSYGVSAGADWRIVDPLPTPVGITFSVVGRHKGSEIRVPIALGQPGMHNARNATAAFVMAIALGADPERAAGALNRFGGVGRRFEERGEWNGARLIDDYAHLPTEVAAALAAARSTGAERVIAVFQPHRYSRTQQLHATFADAFVDADVLIVTGIFASSEAPRPGVTGALIADAVRASHPEADVHYIESLDDVETALRERLRPGDLLITLGAGDLTTMADRFSGADDAKGRP